MTNRSVVVLCIASLSTGCTAIGGFDEFHDELGDGEGGSGGTGNGDVTGGATTTGIDPGPTTGGGGEGGDGAGGVGSGGTGGGPVECVTGCWDGTACRSGQEIAFCGAGGQECASCVDSNPCTQDRCEEGQCKVDAIDGVCAGGTCEEGQCVALEEDCSNRQDDNNDGLIDCNDPLCQGLGYRCAPVAPIGWDGPAAFHDGPTSIECGGAFDEEIEDGHTGLTAAPATCAACTCKVDGAVCGAATLTASFAAAGACDAACESNVTLAPNACVSLAPAVPGCATTDPAAYAADTVTTGMWGGECDGMGGQATRPPATWATSSALCGTATGAGCSPATVCVPPAPPGFSTAVCIGAAGDVACPASYPTKTVIHRAVADTRGCSPCGCEFEECTGSVKLYSGDACGGAEETGQLDAPSAGACTAIGATAPRAKFVVDGMAPKCSATPAAPTGAALPSSPYTVCCTP